MPVDKATNLAATPLLYEASDTGQPPVHLTGTAATSGAGGAHSEATTAATTVEMADPQQQRDARTAFFNEVFSPGREWIEPDRLHGVRLTGSKQDRDEQAQLHAEATRREYDAMVQELSGRYEHLSAEQLQTAIDRAKYLDTATNVAMGVIGSLPFAIGGWTADHFAGGAMEALASHNFSATQSSAIYGGAAGTAVGLVEAGVGSMLQESTFTASPYYMGMPADGPAGLHPTMQKVLAHYAEPAPTYGERVGQMHNMFSGYTVRNGVIGATTTGMAGLGASPSTISATTSVLENGGGVGASLFGARVGQHQRVASGAYGPHIMLSRSDGPALVDGTTGSDAMRSVKNLGRFGLGIAEAVLPPYITHPLSNGDQSWAKTIYPPVAYNMSEAESLKFAGVVGGGFALTSAASTAVSQALNSHLDVPPDTAHPGVMAAKQATNVIGKHATYTAAGAAIANALHDAHPRPQDVPYDVPAPPVRETVV